MTTRPKLYRVDQVTRNAVVIADPSALLLENGPGFSVLISQRVESNPLFGAIDLHDVFQLRFEDTGRSAIRYHALVRVARHPESSLWIATDPVSQAIFSCPSVAPYVFVDLLHREHKKLRELADLADTDSLFSHCRDAFGRLPGFYSPDSDSLISPDDYACAWSFVPDRNSLL